MTCSERGGVVVTMMRDIARPVYGRVDHADVGARGRGVRVLHDILINRLINN